MTRMGVGALEWFRERASAFIAATSQGDNEPDRKQNTLTARLKRVGCTLGEKKRSKKAAGRATMLLRRRADEQRAVAPPPSPRRRKPERIKSESRCEARKSQACRWNQRKKSRASRKWDLLYHRENRNVCEAMRSKGGKGGCKRGRVPRRSSIVLFREESVVEGRQREATPTTEKGAGGESPMRSRVRYLRNTMLMV